MKVTTDSGLGRRRDSENWHDFSAAWHTLGVLLMMSFSLCRKLFHCFLRYNSRFSKTLIGPGGLGGAPSTLSFRSIGVLVLGSHWMRLRPQLVAPKTTRLPRHVCYDSLAWLCKALLNDV